MAILIPPLTPDQGYGFHSFHQYPGGFTTENTIPSAHLSTFQRDCKVFFGFLLLLRFVYYCHLNQDSESPLYAGYPVKEETTHEYKDAVHSALIKDKGFSI